MMKRIDWLLAFATIGLVLFSIFFVYSSSLDAAGSIQSAQFVRQLLFAFVGLIVMIIVMHVPADSIKAFIPVFYGAVLLLLALTLIIGEVRNGSRSWIRVGPINLQMSEFSKAAAILMYAFLIARNLPDFSKYKTSVLYSGIAIAPMLLVLLQPDLGTALVFIPLAIVIFYIAGAGAARIFFVVGAGASAIMTLVVSYAMQNAVDATGAQLLRTGNFYIYAGILAVVFVLSALGLRIFAFLQAAFSSVAYISFMLLSGAGLAYAATKVLKTYQLQRLLVFVNPESDALGSGWHILQSVAAIGSGGFFGAGFLQGRQSSMQFLPQKSTDFIFSLIGEQLGFVGSMSVVLLYTLLMWRLIIIGTRSRTEFSRICCAGVLAVFLTHFMVNIGMTLGMMPITGIPLLLVSYGGSSLISAFLMVGVVQSVYRFEVSEGSSLQAVNYF